MYLGQCYNLKNCENLQGISPSELNQNRFHCVVTGPVGKAGELGRVNLIFGQLSSPRSCCRQI